MWIEEMIKYTRNVLLSSSQPSWFEGIVLLPIFSVNQKYSITNENDISMQNELPKQVEFTCLVLNESETLTLIN